MAIGGKACDLTIVEAAAVMARGELSPVELVRSCLERIDSLEDRIRAWAVVDREGALKAAQKLGDELRRGQNRGPLHGIPVGIKDIFYTAGLSTEAGAPFWSGFTPSFDATAVARLREAGAIILGKTHTTQFAHLDPSPTRNPWNIAHTPGGSSSGSGAGVAAGMCLAALGSQTGGSTLRPAAFNGVVGLKSESGRISKYGVVPVSWTLDHMGIIARSVEDAAIVFQAIAGHDPNDTHSLGDPVPDCISHLRSLRPPRLGLARQHFFEHADEEMRRHTEEVAERLRRAGAAVEEVSLPASFADIPDTAQVITSVEAAAYHREMFAEHTEDYKPHIRQLIEEGLATPATRYASALEARLQQRADVAPLLNTVDALITPGAPGAAPGLETTGKAVMQRPWSVTGVPAIGIPTGLSAGGLPLAVQLVGPPKREDQLLAVALWCERALGVHLRPPVD